MASAGSAELFARPVVRVRPRWRVLGMVLCVEALLLVCAPIASYAVWRQWRLDRDGRVAQAEVVVSRPRTRSRIDVLYRLRLGGRVYWRKSLFGQRARWATVSAAEREDVLVRRVVSVRYLPDDPEVSNVASARRRESPPLAMAILLVLGATLLPFGVLSARRRARLEAEANGRANLPMWRAIRGPRAF